MAHPTTMATIGAHSRIAGDPRSITADSTASDTTAIIGAAYDGVSSGTAPSSGKMAGITVAVISMITDPDTTGVKIRRSSDSLAASRNWNSDDTTIRLAMVAGPLSRSAAMHTAKNAPDVPMIRMCPDPIRPNRTACISVVKPLTSSTENAAHAR